MYQEIEDAHGKFNLKYFPTVTQNLSRKFQESLTPEEQIELEFGEQDPYATLSPDIEKMLGVENDE